LTSDGSANAAVAESNLQFNGSRLLVSGSIVSFRTFNASGLGWNTAAWVGNYSDYLSDGAFPTYLPAAAFGHHAINSSDGVFVGLISRGAGSNDYNAVIAWGDDTDDVLQYRFNNSVVGSLSTTGTFDAIEGFTVNGGAGSGRYLRGNGTRFVGATIQAGDVPTLNQNTTGTAANVTGIVAVVNGGTGANNAGDARTNLGATTVGSNFFTLTNPGAIGFIRINADNTVSALNGAGFRSAIGATTVGDSFFRLTDPSAITFPRINANNTVSALSAADFRTAIGAGTGNGTVTSVGTGTGLTGGTITTTGTISHADTSTLDGAYGTNGISSITVDSLGHVTAISTATYTGNTGTVTSVSGTGTASGLTLSGTVTTTGDITLSGTVNSLAAGTYSISVTGNAGTVTNGAYTNSGNAFTASGNSFRNRIGIGDGNGTPYTNTGSPGVWLSYNGAADMFMGSYNSTTWGVYIGAWKYTVDSNGDTVASGNVTGYGTPSDIRYKENVKPIFNALNKVLQLEGKTFNWKPDTKQHSIIKLESDVGFIAQQVQEVLPEIVRKNDDGYLSIRERAIVPLLVEAIKEQQKQIDELKKKLGTE
jgi:hypothetical protein